MLFIKVTRVSHAQGMACFMDNHSDIFKKKAGDATQLHLDGMNQQAQSEHKNNVENVHIHGIVLQN